MRTKKLLFAAALVLLSVKALIERVGQWQADGRKYKADSYFRNTSITGTSESGFTTGV